MTSDHSDPVLATLLLPFATGGLGWPAAGDALFLRARAGAALRDVARAGLCCEQSYKPAADALVREGWAPCTSDEADAGRYSLVLVLPPRQRQEARALLARAERSAAE